MKGESMTANMAAFLTMISHSEGTDRPPAPADPYRTCYGFKHVIVSLSDHPSVDTPGHPAEWHGESLVSLGSQYAHSISTAAGRYQLIRPTWMECQAALGLTDFTGPSQDDAAIWLIKEKGAMDIVNSGRVTDGIELCHGIWASLPGNSSGQPHRSVAELIHAYADAGGAFA
jgi:muramidase (phage lysozyme)